MRAASIIAHERLQPVAVINHSYTDAVPIGAAFVERPASDNQRASAESAFWVRSPCASAVKDPATSTNRRKSPQPIDLHHVRILQGI